MNEHDLRAAMRQALAVQPPPMSDEPVLAAAHQDRRRRRAAWGSAGTAAAVAVVAAGVVLLVPAESGPDSRPGGLVGGTSSSEAPAPPEDERAAALAAVLDELVPTGYTPTDLPNSPRFHQGGGTGDNWTYDATTAITKGSWQGTLAVYVTGPGKQSTGEGCSLTPTPWTAGTGDCTDVTIDGKTVGVVEMPDVPGVQFAGFRYADGTRVFVTQSVSSDEGDSARYSLPLTREQLAAMTVDPRLKIR